MATSQADSHQTIEAPRFVDLLPLLSCLATLGGKEAKRSTDWEASPGRSPIWGPGQSPKASVRWGCAWGDRPPKMENRASKGRDRRFLDVALTGGRTSPQKPFACRSCVPGTPISA
jgi:hypothetical protein